MFQRHPQMSNNNSYLSSITNPTPEAKQALANLSIQCPTCGMRKLAPGIYKTSHGSSQMSSNQVYTKVCRFVKGTDRDKGCANDDHAGAIQASYDFAVGPTGQPQNNIDEWEDKVPALLELTQQTIKLNKALEA